MDAKWCHLIFPEHDPIERRMRGALLDVVRGRVLSILDWSVSHQMIEVPLLVAKRRVRWWRRVVAFDTVADVSFYSAEARDMNGSPVQPLGRLHCPDICNKVNLYSLFETTHGDAREKPSGHLEFTSFASREFLHGPIHLSLWLPNRAWETRVTRTGSQKAPFLAPFEGHDSWNSGSTSIPRNPRMKRRRTPPTARV